jgi:polyvinyl alcohol dehydrogenase (cytochrome)
VTRRRSGTVVRALAVALSAGVVASALAAPALAADHRSEDNGPTTTITATDWPTYGHDRHHGFTGSTSLTTSSARTLTPAWFFPTGDAVTANPIVVGDTVYVGSWDGFFYAIDRAHGTLRWKYQLKAQPAINPSPGNTDPRDVTTDGGLVTSSAWFQPGTSPHNEQSGTVGGGRARGRPDLVIFGAGYTLYALVATGSNAGQLYWSHDYTGLPEQPPSPTTDSTRIFSSPVVFRDRVIVGVSSDGGDGHRGYVVSTDLDTGNPIWRFETDVDATGHVLNNGCGGVWSSPTVDEARGLAVVGVADCHQHGTPPYHERVLALRVADGSLAWVFTPPRLRAVPAGQDPACDFDFGATANLGAATPQDAAFLGIGGKDGTYYRIDPGTGTLVWQRNVVFGGSAGGFIATTAYDGQRIYGATAIGDLGSPGPCTNGTDPRDLPVQEPSGHALNLDGSIAWQQRASQALGPTTAAGGMTFVGNAFSPTVQIRNAADGALLNTLALASSCFCAIAVSGNGVFFGTGSPQQGTGNGVYAYTPLGAPPTR